MAFKYIQYVYPVPYNFEKFLIWASGNFNCYFAIKEKQDDSWIYYAGNGSHALATGKLLTSYGSSQSNAETNYLTTSKDSNNKIIAVLPSLSFARFIRLYIDDVSSEYIYEFRPSTRLLADEIIAGNLEITDDFLVPPLITVKSSSVDRIKIGNFSGSTFGIVGYDASSNLIFEISDNQQVIGGFTLGSGGFSGGSDIKIDSANKRISINSDTFGSSGIQLDYNSGSPRAYIGDGTNQYFEFDGTDVFWKGNNAELTKAGQLAVSNINATGGLVGGWSLSQYKLTCDSGAVGLNSEATGGTDWRIWAGNSTPSSAPFRVDENGNFYATSATINGSITATTGTIGGWIVGTSKLQSDSSNEMIVLDQGKLRISIFDAVNEKVVMGYLDGLTRNNGSGTATSGSSNTLTDTNQDWQTDEHSSLEVTITGGDGSGQTRTISSNTSDTLTISGTWTTNPSAGSTYEIRYTVSDYGFWARSGDKLRIDGDVTYESGDWIVQHDGSYLIQDSVGHNIIRLGTDTGEKGLFIYNTDGTQLAKLISNKIYIGTAGDYLQYDTSNGMQIAGTITVSSGSSGISNFSDAGPLVDASNLDEVPDGTSYARVLASSLSSGLVLLSQASGSLDNISDGTNYGRVNLTSISAGNILLSAAIGSLDDISDGTSYGRVLVTDISAGHILLASATGSLDDISDGTSYGRILITDISAGHILLSAATGDLDDISDGTSYGRVLTTAISAGKIILTSGIGVTGTLPVANTEADVTSDQFTNSLATIDAQTDKVELGLDSNGVLVTKVIPASAVAPTGAGLYLGSDYLGYYDSSSWVTYMDNSGNFYLGGSNGPLQWDSSSSSLTIGVGALPSLPSDENIKGYWSFDEGSGSSLNDSSINGNDGTIYNSPSWVTGKSGYALSFDGTSNQYVQLDSPNDVLPGSNSMSVCGWIKGTWSGTGYDRFFNAYEINSQTGTQFFAGADNSTGKLRVRFSDGTNYAVTTFTDVTWLDGSWHHVAVVYDRSDGKTYVYIDAVKSSTELNIAYITGSIDTVTTFRFAADGGASNNRLNGSMDEVRIYDKALSQDEIKALYLNPGGQKAPDPTADTTANNTAYDTNHVNGVASSNISGWAYSSDVTKIDGGKIYTGTITADSILANTITASKITIGTLDSLSNSLGEITSGIITGATIRTATSGKRVVMNSDGLRLETGATGKTYGDSSYKYGDSTRKYGSGVLAYILHKAKGIPFYVNEEQNVADFHYYDRSSIPTGAAEKGDTCVVNGVMKICTTGGTPGTWVSVGGQT